MAGTVELKGANGRSAQFKVESVGPEGIQAVPNGRLRAMLLKWEQLDLEWLASNRPEIWKQKQQIERMASAAFKGFDFKEDRNSVFLKINNIGGVRISGEAFGDSNPNSVWVTVDPKTYKQVFKFSFNNEQQLVGIELHQHFSSKLPINGELKAEWERLVGMVKTFHISALEDDGFPSQYDWRRFTKQSAAKRENQLVTHRWEDKQRKIELGVTAREIRMEGPLEVTGKATLFGVEMRPSSSIPSENTNWLIYSATIK